MITSHMCPVTQSCCRIESLAQKPRNGGIPAVENISPDTVIDEKGNAYYVVRVRTHLSSFNDKLPIIPGMVAEVDILTGKKTVLSYLLKPILKVKSYALRER